MSGIIQPLRRVFSRLVMLSGLLIWWTIACTAPAHAQIVTCYGRPITTLDFRNPVLVSGTAGTVGAIYRFANVAMGVDARVRINALNNASLAIIDRDTGLLRNFQPELAGNAPGNIDFTITFVVAGTTTPLAIDFAASGIDIDGDSASLREYSEFTATYAAYILDSNTNLDVNASGPSSGSMTRFESMTNFTAPGIDPTATQNIVSVLYTSTSTFNYRIGSLGSGSTTRLNSLDFSCPALPLPSQTTIVPQDFGDAPASYANPVHDIVPNNRIGPTNTAETARYNSPDADGDTGDSGVTIPQLRKTFPATINVQVTGSGGRLQAWLDYNGNGSFNDVGEQIATNVTDNGTGDANPASGIIGLTITPPSEAVVSRTFARFRWSTIVGLGPTGTASNGEVEDYAVTILGLPRVTASKVSAVYNPSGTSSYAVPGNEVVYTITTTNTGDGPTDANSVFIVDRLPPQLTFFNGDFDGAGPVVGPIEFTAAASGLTFNPASDVRYSNTSSAPVSFAACSYTPTAGYDASVKFICLNPQGTMAAGPTPATSFTVRFRALIN